jgi:hypothetical protein
LHTIITYICMHVFTKHCINIIAQYCTYRYCCTK